MAISYSTSGIRPRDRLSYWRESVIKDFAKHEIRSCVGPEFQANVQMELLGALGVATFECDPCEVTRTSQHIARCDSDNLILSLQLAGSSIMSQGGRQAILESGSFGIWDTLRPGAFYLSGRTKCITLTIPRREMEARLGPLAPLTARALDARKPLAGLASGFLTMLPNHIGGLDAATAAKVAEHALDLVALAFSSVSEKGLIAISSSRAFSLIRLKSAIEARLGDPELKPAAAAAAAGISVRYANALLASEGTSVERYILGRRLERCRRALEDPAQAHRLIGDIAFSWGFTDLSHFGRRFRDEFGCSPGDYRRQVK